MSSSAVRVKARQMPYVRLGKSGLKVSRLILGCMSYGTPEWEGWVLPEDRALEHIKLAYDAGINTFDTANGYSFGESERILGRAIKKFDLPREEIVVMTKLYFSPARIQYNADSEDLKTKFNGIIRPELLITNLDTIGLANRRGLSRKHIFDSVKASLERLELEYIDVLICHRFDNDTPIEETMQALHDVVKAGYARYIGMSSCFAWQFHAMQNYAITNNLTPFISMQNHYNLVYREEEREMFPTLKHFNVGSTPWSPLACGVVARPYGDRAAVKDSARDKTNVWTDALAYKQSPGTEAIVNAVEKIAKNRGVSMAQIGIAWLLAKEGVTAPIIGTTSIEKLKDLIAAVNIKLTPEEILGLEKGYKPTVISGHY